MVVWVLLDENALRREVGSLQIMYDAVTHLADVARRPNVTVQVIPGIGSHPGLLRAFAIAQAGNGSSVVYLESAAEGQTIEVPETVREMELRFDSLTTDALTGRTSQMLMERVAEEWEQMNSAAWRTSSYSGSNGGNCVETGFAPGAVLVRDTEDRAGAILAFSPAPGATSPRR